MKNLWISNHCVYPWVLWCDYKILHSPENNSQFALSLFHVEVRRLLPHFKSLLKYRPKGVKGIIPCSCGCKLHTMTGVKTLPVHIHTRSLTYFSFYRSHTLCSRLQSSVSYWPSVSLPIQLSVHTRVCVPQCEGVTDPDGDRFIITRRSLLFLLLFYYRFYC